MTPPMGRNSLAMNRCSTEVRRREVDPLLWLAIAVFAMTFGRVLGYLIGLGIDWWKAKRPPVSSPEPTRTALGYSKSLK